VEIGQRTTWTENVIMEKRKKKKKGKKNMEGTEKRREGR